MTNVHPVLQPYLRERREAREERRLELAKLLRENPAATNVDLAKILNVTRDTIALDRKVLMEQLQSDTKSETEKMREEMLQQFETLQQEVELHRKDGKLSLAAIDRMLDIGKAIVELTGCRKPVFIPKKPEEKEPLHFVVTFPEKKLQPPTIDAEVVEQPQLEAGDAD